MPTKVIVDANVLFSRTLRDWLSLLYLNNDTLFSVYWTEDIVAETIYRLRREHPDWSGARMTRLHDVVRETFEGGRVDDFTPSGSYQGADPGDQHVHEAAVACGAHILLTSDEGFDGPGVDPDHLPYEVYRPDDFFVLVDDSAPEVVTSATAMQVEYWFRRSGDVNLPQYLRKANCPTFADRVRTHLQQLGPTGGELASGVEKPTR